MCFLFPVTRLPSPATVQEKDNPLSTPSASSTITSECTECAGTISITRQPLCGEIVRCTECQAELEITSVDPLRLELAPEVEEDWGE